MRKNKKRAFAAILSLLFGTPVFASCSNTSSSVAPHECVFYKVDAVEATCLHEGNIAYEQCPYCKKIQVNGAEKSLEDVTLPIDPKNHEQLRSVPEVPATCIADGTKAYQYCDACSNYVLDGVNYTDETIGDKLVLPKEAAEHDFVHYAQMNPTCIPGMKEHDYCSVCHKYFVNGQEVSEESLTIPAAEDHIFGPSGICGNGCESYRYPNTDAGQVFEPQNRLPLVPTAGEGWCDTGSDKEEMIASTHANKGTFHTQRGSNNGSVNVWYEPNGSYIEITFSGSSTANNSFTRFAPGQGDKAYTGRLSLAFDFSVGADTAISRIGAKVVDYSGDAFSGQDKLLGFNSAEENNPDRKLEAGVTYRFVYDMEVTNKNEEGEAEEQLIQIWACGGASNYIIKNLRYVERPDLETTGTVQSKLLYFGRADNMSVNEKDILANEITLDQTSLSLVKGQSKKIEVTAIKPENAADKTVTWSSADEKVASVDENGNVTGVAPGTTTITAKVGLASATCNVTVTDSAIPVTSVSLDKKSMELHVGDKGEQLAATISPENATDKTVSWSSSDATVAKVDQNGFVTPVKEGTATITVTTKDGGKTDSCLVTVLPEPVVEKPSFHLYDGKDFFDGSSWYDTTSAATPRGDAIVDENGSLVFTKDTQSRIDLFYVTDKKIHLGDKAEKWTGDMEKLFGKTFRYDMTLKADGNFDLLLLGGKDAYQPSTNSKYNFYLHFEEGKISLRTNSYDEEDRGSFDLDTDLFVFGKQNDIRFDFTRVDSDTLTFALSINGKSVVFPAKEYGKYYSVDSNGVFTSDTFLAKTGYGQRFGVYPDESSTVAISAFSIDPAPEQPKPAEGIALDKSELTLTEGDSTTLYATLTPEGAAGTVSWKSSDEKVATVDSNGTVTAVAPGTATITATVNGQSATCKVTVEEKKANEPTKPCTAYNGKEFFTPGNWDDSTGNAKPRDESILDENGNLVFTSDTKSRFDLFHCAGENGSYLHYGDAANKSGIDAVVGKSTTYTMAISSTGAFDLMILGVKGAYGPSTSGAASHYLHIGEDGKVSLDLTGPNSDHFSGRFTGASSFKMGQENTLSLTLTRVSKDALTIAIEINGEKVLLEGETFEGSRGVYSVDENGVLTNTYPSSNSGMGQRFGVYPEGDSIVTISGLAIENN